MAEFEPGGRPPRPPSDPITDRLGKADEAARKLGQRRWLPRLPVPKRLKRTYERLPEETRYRISVVWGFAQTGIVILFATLSVALVLKAVTNATIFDPDNAKEVFAGVDDPRDLAYSVETVRFKEIDGSVLRLDTVRGVQVDPEERKMMALMSGVGVTSFRTAYDGKIWLLKYRNTTRPQQVLRTLSANELKPVYASELEPLGTNIVNDKATVDRQRGWLVNFRPNRQVLLRLLQAPILTKLGLADQDLRAISRGKFQTIRARATVLRGDRRLYQIDVLLRINGARLRILATYRKQDEGRMKTLDLKPPKRVEVN